MAGKWGENGWVMRVDSSLQRGQRQSQQVEWGRQFFFFFFLLLGWALPHRHWMTWETAYGCWSRCRIKFLKWSDSLSHYKTNSTCWASMKLPYQRRWGESERQRRREGEGELGRVFMYVCMFSSARRLRNSLLGYTVAGYHFSSVLSTVRQLWKSTR